ncbi:FliH/SctL family protein [Novosphingobium lentum]|uniref:FliH/SctL family protein n=1 Tax=Novosphingobium lentum TaxID=145287 RepID=UPI0009FFEB9D|nr:FliH/SctL family protein [Novosphingobium lentum]
MSDRFAGAAPGPSPGTFQRGFGGGKGGLGVVQGGFARDARFAAADPAAPPVPRPAEDPVATAFARGHATGCAETLEQCAAQADADDAARGAIALALARLDEAGTSQLAERLRTTVIALCEAAIAPAALDHAALARRVAIAAAMLARAEDARVIRLNPEDMALIAAQMPAGWAIEPDPALERGALRVEGGQGGVEDGPDQWRRAIVEALDAC